MELGQALPLVPYTVPLVLYLNVSILHFWMLSQVLCIPAHVNTRNLQPHLGYSSVRYHPMNNGRTMQDPGNNTGRPPVCNNQSIGQGLQAHKVS